MFWSESILIVKNRLDKIRNERIRGSTKVGEITKKVQERRLKWYGHVLRREEQDIRYKIQDTRSFI